MEVLVLSRHGHYYGRGTASPGGLTEEGKEEIRRLAERLRPLVEKKKTAILCSRQQRTIESASILSAAFPEALHKGDGMIGEGDGEIEALRVLQTIQEKAGDSEVVVVVGHLPDIIAIASHYACKFRQRVGDHIACGEAIVIDLITQRVERSAR